ncbi:MAG: peptidoglycan bridge formation glycyltransferase FemA/FemB family protein [Micrococcales bacterium]|nr:peptidoglycan bridge formation glycyltransferase FemA/FemB family protein [Micrococcales bacterium]
MTARTSHRLEVRSISASDHLDYVRGCAGASYLQCPSWGQMPPRWHPESVGWFEGRRLRGVGLVLYRRVPIVGSLAYLGEGPVVDWADLGAEDITAPLLDFLRTRAVFSVTLAPALVLRRWRNEALRAALRVGQAQRLRDLTPDVVDETATEVAIALRGQGWRQYEATGPGFGGKMNPRYRSHVPLTPLHDPSTDHWAGLRARLDTSWRRNLRRSTASGVTVEMGGALDLPVFHRLYVETATRDKFAPLPLAFFERLWRELRAEDPKRIELYLASYGGQVHAAAIRTRVGDEFSYTHGASSNAGRRGRPSNALQWRMLTDAAAAGASVYDLRGISDTLDPDDRLFGLLRFKLGLGADAVEMVGEWDYPLRRVRHHAVAAYLDRRQR